MPRSDRARTGRTAALRGDGCCVGTTYIQTSYLDSWAIVDKAKQRP
ncbi:hypothetical protein ACFOZ0_24575 [Streptomyces yaanensis]|uniref:Uncharacterized protein n=1 Tax=Streptomyces yaanensis TaxID=1142239 RepID=A0ABV7SMA4_9ACTN|nr:hypothetical protein [Streptomyces sp. CGMCC 4.7035]WNC01370.1 hypothetical protein Q2K21_26780 [Streptomyces sp. CGMCC 4.7035]